MLRAKLFFISVFVFIVNFSFGQLNYQWAFSVGGSSSAIAGSTLAITTDNNGNEISCGIGYDTIDMDPSAATFNLDCQGNSDIIVAKYSSTGSFIWAFNLGSNSSNGESAYHIHLDFNGNIFISGIFSDTVDFDPGLGNYPLIANATNNFFIAKYDSNGNFIWAHSIINTWSLSQNDFAIDNANNIIFTGAFSGTVDFDPGAGITNLSSTSIGQFICKYDNNGNFIWAKAIQTSNGGMHCGQIEITNANQLIIAGFLSGTADFDPSVANYNVSIPNGQGYFMAKYDSNGQFMWIKTLTGNYIAAGRYSNPYMTIDSNDEIIFTDSYHGTIDFDPSSSNYNLSSSTFSVTDQDFFLAKYDLNGNFLWVNLFGDRGDNHTYNVVCDPMNQIYISGRFEDTVDFDAGIGQSLIAPVNNQTNSFLAEYSPSGNYIFSMRINGDGNALYANQNNFYYGGDCNNSDLDPGVGVANWGQNNTSMFLAKYGTVLGIPPNISENNISLYPNPSSEFISVQLSSPIKNGVAIIYNSLGQEVFRQPINYQQEKFSIAQLSNGFYFLTISSTNEIISSRKFEVIHQ